MSQYVIADEMTGRVLGFVDQDDTPDPVEGCLIVENPAPVAHYPEAPTETSVLRMVDGVLTWSETASLEELRIAKRAEITRHRLEADADHFVYQDKQIRTADKDMIDLFSTNGYVALFGEFDPSWPGGWKTIDNTYLPIATVDEWKLFYKAMYLTGISNFRKSQQLKARIDAATTAEELNSITWDSEVAA